MIARNCAFAAIGLAATAGVAAPAAATVTFDGVTLYVHAGAGAAGTGDSVNVYGVTSLKAPVSISAMMPIFVGQPDSAFADITTAFELINPATGRFHLEASAMVSSTGAYATASTITTATYYFTTDQPYDLTFTYSMPTVLNTTSDYYQMGGGFSDYHVMGGVDPHHGDQGNLYQSNGAIRETDVDKIKVFHLVPGVYAMIIDGGDSVTTYHAGDVSAVTDSVLTFNLASADAVPEPANWAMMLAGFGGIGGAMRGRRLKTAAIARTIAR